MTQEIHFYVTEFTIDGGELSDSYTDEMQARRRFREVCMENTQFTDYVRLDRRVYDIDDKGDMVDDDRLPEVLARWFPGLVILPAAKNG